MKLLLALALLGCAALLLSAAAVQASPWLLLAALMWLPLLVLGHESAHWAVGRLHGLQGRIEWTLQGRLQPRYHAPAQPRLDAHVQRRVLLAGPTADATALLLAGAALVSTPPGWATDIALGAALSASLMFASNARPVGQTDAGRLLRLRPAAAGAARVLLPPMLTLLALLALGSASLALARYCWPTTFGGVP